MSADKPWPYAVLFRGRWACPCQAEWLPVFEALAQQQGILAGPLPLSQLIGGAVASGGTHAGGGADDSYPLTGVKVAEYVRLSRQMGADATWERPYNWDGRSGVQHVHRVLRGCPHNTPALYQYLDARQGVDHGRDGLWHGGAGAPDTGPRPLSKRTWREGIKWAQAQMEDEMTPEDRKALVNDIASEVVGRLMRRHLNKDGSLDVASALRRAAASNDDSKVRAQLADLLAAVERNADKAEIKKLIEGIDAQIVLHVDEAKAV